MHPDGRTPLRLRGRCVREDGPVAVTRTVVVVGAGPGLGAAVARRFAREGYRVALIARSADGLDLEGMDLAGPPVVLTADVADEAALRAAFARLRAEAGDPEV